MHTTSAYKKIIVHDWGYIAYPAAWHRQEALHAELVAHKRLYAQPTAHHLIFCEHPHVYTLGRRRLHTHLSIDEQILRASGATFVYANRGGGITWCKDIHRYLRLLEEAVIHSLQDFNLVGGRISQQTGVWIDAQNPKRARKICAVGIRVRRWISMHGLALNVYPDLRYFDPIDACGLRNSQVTSMAVELGKQPDMQHVTASLAKHIMRIFDR